MINLSTLNVTIANVGEAANQPLLTESDDLNPDESFDSILMMNLTEPDTAPIESLPVDLIPAQLTEPLVDLEPLPEMNENLLSLIPANQESIELEEPSPITMEPSDESELTDTIPVLTNEQIAQMQSMNLTIQQPVPLQPKIDLDVDLSETESSESQSWQDAPFEKPIDMKPQLMQELEPAPITAKEMDVLPVPLPLEMEAKSSQSLDNKFSGSASRTGATDFSSMLSGLAAPQWQANLSEDVRHQMNYEVAVPVGQTPNWKDAFSEQVVLINKNDFQSASIKLNPPELGPIDVHIHIHKDTDEATVNFVSQHALVRDAVESALPRLREMFSESGTNVLNVNVSDQNQSKQSREGRELDPGRRGIDNSDPIPTQSRIEIKRGGIDFYA